eukprot:1702483-Pyramimonas_sp.AAC.1
MHVLPHGPSAELPMRPRNAGVSAGTACECSHRGLLRGSPWGHEALSWVGGPHASAATGAF